MDVLVDDHLLLRVLLDDEPTDLRDPGARIHTTGLWYHRLCRALARPEVVGFFTRKLGEVEAIVATSAIEAVTALPYAIGLTSMRDLAWLMAQVLKEQPTLNLLSLEALAAAEHLEAELCLAERDANPPLLLAASAMGVPLRLLST